MVYHLLLQDRPAALKIAQALQQAVQDVGHCKRCHTLTHLELCAICADTSRDETRLCIIETPADQAALEKTGVFRGYYFVLMGKLSPLEGVGPHDIGMTSLLNLFQSTESSPSAIKEVIIATNFTAEGEITAHVIAQALKAKGVVVTRLARGIPAGSEIEYVDLSTIAHAMVDRR
jgi:recombination protein RecR